MPDDRWKHYKEGEMDSKGRKVLTIMSHTDTYVIYEAGRTLQLEGDFTLVDQSPKTCDLLSRIMGLTPPDVLQRRKVFYQLAAALDQCLAGHEAACLEMLEAIHEKVSVASIGVARQHYIWAAIVMSMGALVTFWWLWVLREVDWEHLAWYQAFAYGALGAVFSVLLNQDTIQVNLNYRRLTHWTAGASRPVVGVIAAGVVYTAIKAKILPIGGTEATAPYAALFFCFLSGFSETFVPNLLNKNQTMSLANGTPPTGTPPTGTPPTGTSPTANRRRRNAP